MKNQHQIKTEKKEANKKVAQKSWKKFIKDKKVTPMIWKKWIVGRKGSFAPSEYELSLVGLGWADYCERGWFKRLCDGWETNVEEVKRTMSCLTDPPASESPLLPCPFCGEEPHLHRVRDGWKLSCRCGASVVAYDGGEVVEDKWNLRVNTK